MLLHWDEFLKIIEDKWIVTQLKHLKRISTPLSIYTDPFDIPFEQLSNEGKSKLIELRDTYWPIRDTCWRITKSDLQNPIPLKKWYCINQFSCIEDYLRFLINRSSEGIQEFESLFESERICISPDKFINPDGYTYMFLN